MKNQYVNGTFSKSYFTASNNFDIKLSKSLCSNIEQWFLDCDDMQSLPRNEKGELANKTLKGTNYELLSLPKYANEKGKMLKVDNEKKDEIRFFLANFPEYKGQKKIRDLFDNSTVYLNNYMKKFFDTVEAPKNENEIMQLAYSNLYNLMAKNNITMDTFYNFAMQLEDENNINIEKVEELKIKSA